MDIAFSAFDWDEGNRDKCRKHGLATADIEAMFRAPFMLLPAPGRAVNEDRLKAIGVGANGRHIFVVFTLRHRGGEVLIRPISARHMRRKEIEHYERQKIQAEKAAKTDDG
jgi:uncharacterized DUF497 family protein